MSVLLHTTVTSIGGFYEKQSQLSELLDLCDIMLFSVVDKHRENKRSSFVIYLFLI